MENFAQYLVYGFAILLATFASALFIASAFFGGKIDEE